MTDLLARTCLCLLLAATAFATPVRAQEEEPPAEDQHLMVDPAFSDDPDAVVPAEPSAAERQRAAEAARGPETARGNGAQLRGLDKITGRTEDFNLAIGQTAEFGRLEVSLAECRYPAADPSSDAYAELTIIDRRANARLFSGWMIASSPALSALDDSRYDVWVLSCSSA
ncbi:DUF2155 domain-containing protein [Paracoccus sp. TOH]|uniref:DUF2155 domain-containing protein n=1 Tax=Paracoccus sp. TOH TaxID=1263728 RepID=UPI0025B1FDBE|nr:DUF2155 domain-containing protein [Paracoccus sp. TOH]WJS85703.1 DUF2155 domain-containing protein [Paracoccus sp. TOH]